MAFESATPGVFYHGSPDVNIHEFRTVLEQPGGYSTAGVFFTHSPLLAAKFAARQGSGRIYSVTLDTRNPFFNEDGSWDRDFREGLSLEEVRQIETQMILETKAAGYDAAVTSRIGSCLIEIIALRDEVVKRLDSDIRRLPEWDSPRIVDSLTFYQTEGAPGPDFAPDAVRLFGNRRAAEAIGPSQRVVVKPSRPIYCEADIWPHIPFEALPEQTEIDCLVDPRGQGALILDPQTIRAINRTQMRHLRAELRRKPMPRAAIEQGQVAMRGV